MAAPHLTRSVLAPAGDVLFERVKQGADRNGNVVAGRMRIDRHVNVLGHDDITDQAGGVRRLKAVQGVDDYSLHCVIVEELQAGWSCRRRWTSD